MGFEAIENHIQSGIFVEDSVRQRREKGNVSLLRILADRMTTFGAQGIVAFSNARINRSTGTLEVGPQFFKELHSERLEDLGMLFLGTSIIGLENAMLDRHFSLGDHVAMVNTRLKDAPFGYMVSDENKAQFDQNIPLGVWKSMIGLVREDPTFASFFEMPYARELLPNGLKAFLAGASGMDGLLHIQKRYKEAAEQVIPNVDVSAATIQKHRMFLEYFDEMIASIDSNQ